jgi:hypothetical protein
MSGVSLSTGPGRKANVASAPLLPAPKCDMGAAPASPSWAPGTRLQPGGPHCHPTPASSPQGPHLASRRAGMVPLRQEGTETKGLLDSTSASRLVTQSTLLSLCPGRCWLSLTQGPASFLSVFFFFLVVVVFELRTSHLLGRHFSLFFFPPSLSFLLSLLPSSCSISRGSPKLSVLWPQPLYAGITGCTTVPGSQKSCLGWTPLPQLPPRDSEGRLFWSGTGCCWPCSRSLGTGTELVARI